MAFYNKELGEVYSELKSAESGLSNEQAKEKIGIFGENILEKQKKVSFFKKVLNEFKNIMIIILIISAIISIVTAITQNDKDSLFEGILIFVIVLVNAIVGVIQEQKAENALEALAQSTEPYAKVYRNGSLQKIRVHNIVPGDVIELKTGDIVPADVRIISCNNFKCNESSLTGESHSVLKTNKTLKKSNLTISDQENICFSGTSVTSGTAKGIVFATGKSTEIGKIAKILSQSMKEKTPLEKNIDKIGKFLTIGILVIVAIVFVVQLVFNKMLSPIDALLTAVALAVAAIPESLPAVITIIMAMGVQRLAKKNAIIKKLSAVETLGSCNVICSDKTGTLTQNEMLVKHIFDNNQVFESENFDLKNAETLTNICSLCNNAVISNEKINADATEMAIVKFLQEKNIDVLDEKQKHKRIRENEFSSARKVMSVVCENGGKNSVYLKGALDYVVERCDKILINGQAVPLTKHFKNKIILANEKVCEQGERVIAFAYKSIEELANQGNNTNQADKLNENKNLDNPKVIANSKSEKQKKKGKTLQKNSDEENLTFCGFFGIIDPPKPKAKVSVKQCKRAGLKVIMITGDHPATAFSIAKKLGIAKSKKEILTGYDLSKLTAYELSKIIYKYSVFARVTPEHKLMIVNALKSSGNIVAMTGDGVNDAPSIKQANIGVSMGITGTDVTKEVADIIISDDDFSTIVVAVKEGRAIYQNITKTILFLLSTNIVEVLGIFVTSLVVPDAIFLTPTQILFINLVTDSLPAFALGIEPPDKFIMERPPRDPKKSILSGTVGSSIIYQGFVQSLIVLIMFVSAKFAYGAGVASTMSFMTICFMQIIHAINCKTEKSIFSINIFKNKFFNFSFVLLFSMILGAYFVPFFAGLFDLCTLNLTQWLFVALTSISIIPLVELGKLFIKT